LSYPALYTHIRTKHNGITPGGTTQPSGGCKRSRPEDGYMSGDENYNNDNFNNLPNYNNDNNLQYK